MLKSKALPSMLREERKSILGRRWRCESTEHLLMKAAKLISKTDVGGTDAWNIEAKFGDVVLKVKVMMVG